MASDMAGPACLVLAKDVRLAGAVAAGLRSRLAETAVLVPPMSGDGLAVPWAAQRLRAWWDGQRTGVELSEATLLIVDAEELAGVGRVAYVAVPPGQVGARSYAPGSAVIEVPAATVGDLVEAVVTGTPGAAILALPRSRWRARRVWDRGIVRTAVLTGILGFGGWLLSAVLQPGAAQAATMHDHHAVKSGESAVEQTIRDQVNEHLRTSGMHHLPRSAREAVHAAGNLAHDAARDAGPPKSARHAAHKAGNVARDATDAPAHEAVHEAGKAAHDAVRHPAVPKSAREAVHDAGNAARDVPEPARHAVREAGKVARDAARDSGSDAPEPGRHVPREGRTVVDRHMAKEAHGDGVDRRRDAAGLDRATRVVEDLTGKDSPESRQLRRAARIAEHVPEDAGPAGTVHHAAKIVDEAAGEDSPAAGAVHHAARIADETATASRDLHPVAGPSARGHEARPSHPGAPSEHRPPRHGLLSRSAGHLPRHVEHAGDGLARAGDGLAHGPDARLPVHVALPNDLAPPERTHSRPERDSHREHQDRHGGSIIRHVVDEVLDLAGIDSREPDAAPPRHAHLLPAPARESTPMAKPPMEVHHPHTDSDADESPRVTHRGDAGASNAPVLPQVPSAPMPPAPVPSAGKAETVVVPIPPVGGTPQPTYDLPEVVHEAVAPQATPSGPPLAVRLASQAAEPAG